MLRVHNLPTGNNECVTVLRDCTAVDDQIIVVFGV